MSSRSLRKREIAGSKMADPGKYKKGRTKVSGGRSSTGCVTITEVANPQTSDSKSASVPVLTSDSKSASVPVRKTMDLLANLPSYNKANFSNFQPDLSHKAVARKSHYVVPTRDPPFEQIIVTEKSTVQLKFLQEQYERKRNQMKYDDAVAGPSGMSASGSGVSRKRSRIIH